MVKMCENLLADAKSGELQGVMGLVIYDNGNTDQFWADPPKQYHVTVISDRMVGALERMKHQVLRLRLGRELEEAE